MRNSAASDHSGRRYFWTSRYRRPEWSLAAEFRIGYAYEVYAKALLNIPPPPLDKETTKLLKKLPSEERQLVQMEYEDKFRLAMEKYVAGAEQKAQSEYKLTIQLALQGNIANSWTKMAQERMNAYDPENYPRHHDGAVVVITDAIPVAPMAPEVKP